MELLKIIPRDGGNYLKSSLLVYKNALGARKHYEVFSRREIRHRYDLEGFVAGVMVVVLDEKEEKILISEEYRLGVARTIIGVPCGMIGYGETAEEAAAREVKEETGLDVEVLRVTKPEYSNPATTPEKLQIAYAHATGGELTESDNPNEEIRSFWLPISELSDYIQSNEEKMSIVCRLLFEVIYAKKAENKV